MRMKWCARVLLPSLCIIAMGCALFIPRETLYLKSAQDRAGQEEVRKHLGSPMVSTSNQEGEAIWVYQVREEEPGSRWTSSGLWCDEYVLTFDRQAVLRHWTHRSYFHGGELMPTYCVPGGYAKS
jgi:hypothetical protein